MTELKFLSPLHQSLKDKVTASLKSYDYEALYRSIETNPYYKSTKGWRDDFISLCQLTLTGVELIDHCCPSKFIGFVVHNLEGLSDMEKIDDFYTTERLLLVVVYLHEINGHLVGAQNKVAERHNLYM